MRGWSYVSLTSAISKGIAQVTGSLELVMILGLTPALHAAHHALQNCTILTSPAL